jgi:hypothetical protein
VTTRNVVGLAGFFNRDEPSCRDCRHVSAYGVPRAARAVILSSLRKCSP